VTCDRSVVFSGYSGFAPSFVSYKKGYIRFVPASDKVYQLLAYDRWFSPGTLASSITKTGRHDIDEILLKVALNTKNQSILNRLLHDSYISHTLSDIPM